MLEITLIVVASLMLAWPLGIYMAGIFSAQPHASDRIFLPIEKTLYRLLGINAARGMNWKTYGGAFLLSNFLLFIAAFLLFFIPITLRQQCMELQLCQFTDRKGRQAQAL